MSPTARDRDRRLPHLPEYRRGGLARAQGSVHPRCAVAAAGRRSLIAQRVGTSRVWIADVVGGAGAV